MQYLTGLVLNRELEDIEVRMGPLPFMTIADDLIGSLSEALSNSFEIDGHRATISFNRETRLLRGEFVEFGADFYAETLGQLIKEGRASLKIYNEMVEEHDKAR
jgi:hypothetical protein